MDIESQARPSNDPLYVSKTISNLTGFDTAVVFTVTGDVEVEFIAVVPTTQITSTSGTTALSLGVSGSANAFLGDTFVDNGGNLQAGDVWGSGGSSAKYGNWSTKAIIAGGADVSLTVSVDDLTAGNLTIYCRYTPLSAGASVVAA